MMKNLICQNAIDFLRQMYYIMYNKGCSIEIGKYCLKYLNNGEQKGETAKWNLE